MTVKISEGEITSWSRLFLRKNGFDIITSSIKGEKLYYQTEKSHTPRLKQPDSVAIKDRYIFILEDKVLYNDLFKSSKSVRSDVEKLQRLLSNSTLVTDFIAKLETITGVSKNWSIHGGCSSVLNEKSNKILPTEFLHIAIKIKVDNITTFINSNSHRELFPINEYTQNI